MVFKRVVKIAVILMFIAGSVSNAQPKKFNLKLQLIDEKTKEAVEFATVSITKEGSTKAEKYALTDAEGKVVLAELKGGKYTVKGELLGYDPLEKQVEIDKNVDLGEIIMKVQVNFLEQAVVTSVGNPIIIKKDTIEYNASSFKTSDNDMLEELLKKLPGVEVASDGSVTANGKTITKITIDGKTFFLDDPQLATKNIPAKIVEKVKVVEKKSEQAAFSGIDDGNEETVIDLSIMKGMMNGWFGSILAGAGTDVRDVDNDLRFQGSAMIARFTESNQLSFIANGNNTNNRGFNDMASSMMLNMRGSGGMGRGSMGFGGGNGISTSYMTGINGSKTFGNESELSGNYLFNGNEKYITEKTSKNTLKQDGSSLLSENGGYSTTNTYGHRAGARADWHINKNTSILFIPQFNIGYGDFKEVSDFSTQNENSGVKSKINDGSSLSQGDNNSQTANGMILLRQRLGKQGRTVSLNMDYSYSNNVLNGYNKSVTNTYENEILSDSTVVDQMYDQQSKSYGIDGRLSYTEPLGKNFFMEGTYSYDYKKTSSVKSTYNKDDSDDYTIKDEKYSNIIDNEYITQSAGINVMKQEEKYNLTVGATAQPSKTVNVTEVNGIKTTINQNVINYAPNARFDYNFSDYEMIRLRYRGRTSQPSITQLQPVEDNANPLYISRGNPTLTPSFSHRLNTMYNKTNMKSFSSLNVNFDFTYNTNNIVNATWYDKSGVQYSVPMNNDKGTFSTQARIMFNTPIAKSKFSIMSHSNVSYSNSMSFIGKDGVDGDNSESYLNAANFDENRYQKVSANEFLRFVYRDNIIELSLGGNARYSQSWYTITTQEVKATWTNSVTGSANATIPGGIGVVTDGNYTFYYGYDEGYNEPTFVWNAEVNKQLFKGQATLSLKAYDILNQSKNTYRTIADNYVQDVTNNTLGRYVILSFTYRFGTFGGNKNRGPMGRGHMGGGHGMRGPM